MNLPGMGSHHSASAGKDEWLTPPALVRALGHFDLDPCAPIVRPWPTAARHLTIDDDGLDHPWEGRVWMNPPYGQQTGIWLNRLAAHGDGIALIFARTETDDWKKEVWAKADAILFLYGRLRFYHADGTLGAKDGGAPSALIAYGAGNVAALESSGIPGALVKEWRI